MTFEYETEGFTPFSSKSLTEWLNEKGASGWQLVTLWKREPMPGYDQIFYSAIWMRRVEGDSR